MESTDAFYADIILFILLQIALIKRVRSKDQECRKLALEGHFIWEIICLGVYHTHSITMLCSVLSQDESALLQKKQVVQRVKAQISKVPRPPCTESSSSVTQKNEAETFSARI